jgi:hypothetical protein
MGANEHFFLFCSPADGRLPTSLIAKFNRFTARLHRNKADALSMMMNENKTSGV